MGQYRAILVTGGAGFVGSNLAIRLKQRYPDAVVIAVDNLKRRGSEANLPRLRQAGVEYAHGDVRNPEDMAFDRRLIDLIVDCSAEPSVMAGYGESPMYLIDTNLRGTINCLELARRTGADMIFLSTSRVYPLSTLNALNLREESTRYALESEQPVPGVSERGVSERCPLDGARSMYGATKLCSELLIQEYSAMYGVRAIINRCGVLAGPWQMGKVEQGVFALWVAMHYFERELSYIGWGGSGKQVRDLLYIDDFLDLIELQLDRFDHLHGLLFNVGGGLESSLSLLETTHLCQRITGKTVPMRAIPENRSADLALYITDNTRVYEATGWRPHHTPEQILRAIYEWIITGGAAVEHLWL